MGSRGSSVRARFRRAFDRDVQNQRAGPRSDCPFLPAPCGAGTGPAGTLWPGRLHAPRGRPSPGRSGRTGAGLAGAAALLCGLSAPRRRARRRASASSSKATRGHTSWGRRAVTCLPEQPERGAGWVTPHDAGAARPGHGRGDAGAPSPQPAPLTVPTWRTGQRGFLARATGARTPPVRLPAPRYRDPPTPRPLGSALRSAAHSGCGTGPSTAHLQKESGSSC